MRTRTALAIFAFLGLSAPTRAADEITVASPDGRVQFRLSKDAKGSLTYTVTLGSKAVIEPSKIGIVVDKVNLSEGVELGKADAYRVNTTYPWNGPHSTAVDQCNGVKLAVLHSQSHTNYTLEVRAYNDGVAFRHFVPGEGVRVPDEATGFHLPDGATVWYHDTEDHYEGTYMRRALKGVPPGGWLAPPVTYALPQGGGFASITEGGLRHYSGWASRATVPAR